MEFFRRVLRRAPREQYPPDDLSDSSAIHDYSAGGDWTDVVEPPRQRRPLELTYLVGAAGERLRRSPAFAPFSRLSVAITYEGATLKILACDGRRVISWDSVPYDPRLISGAVVAEPYNLGRLIRDSFAIRGLPRWRVHCALPAIGTLSRVVEVPRLAGRDRRRAIVTEGMRALGVSPGRHYVYWQTLDTVGDSQLVFVLAVPRDSMRSLIETMRAAGIRPRSVDITPLALARAVDQPDAIVVELDPSGIDVAIVLDEVPVVLRSVVFDERSLTIEEAQQAAIDVVAIETRRYEDTYVGSRVERSVPVYLAGDLGSGLRLADRIRSATGHPIGRLSPLVDYPEDFPVAEYLANIGLILKDA